MITVGIIGKTKIFEHLDLLKTAVDFLKKEGKKIYFDKNTAPLVTKKEGLTRAELLEKVDIAIVLGGDGTILKTARSMSYHKVLIFGVNLGRLGFLTEGAPENILKDLKRIFIHREFTLDNRALLRVTVYRKGKKVMTSLALNEVVINQGSFARLIDLRTEINQRKIAHFRADGLIIATPTGSTGHSLSAGGPIVHYDLDGLIMTPICPASLANRSIVIPNDRQIKIILDTKRKSEDLKQIGLTLDGQESFQLTADDEIRIRKSGRVFSFIRFGTPQYYRILRKKLKWGI